MHLTTSLPHNDMTLTAITSGVVMGNSYPQIFWGNAIPQMILGQGGTVIQSITPSRLAKKCTNSCHQMSYFKAKMHSLFRLGSERSSEHSSCSKFATTPLAITDWAVCAWCHVTLNIRLQSALWTDPIWFVSVTLVGAKVFWTVTPLK